MPVRSSLKRRSKLDVKYIKMNSPNTAIKSTDRVSQLEELLQSSVISGTYVSKPKSKTNNRARIQPVKKNTKRTRTNSPSILPGNFQSSNGKHTTSRNNTQKSSNDTTVFQLDSTSDSDIEVIFDSFNETRLDMSSQSYSSKPSRTKKTFASGNSSRTEKKVKTLSHSIPTAEGKKSYTTNIDPGQKSQELFSSESLLLLNDTLIIGSPSAVLPSPESEPHRRKKKNSQQTSDTPKTLRYPLRNLTTVSPIIFDLPDCKSERRRHSTSVYDLPTMKSQQKSSIATKKIPTKKNISNLNSSILSPTCEYIQETIQKRGRKPRNFEVNVTPDSFDIQKSQARKKKSSQSVISQPRKKLSTPKSMTSQNHVSRKSHNIYEFTCEQQTSEERITFSDQTVNFMQKSSKRKKNTAQSQTLNTPSNFYEPPALPPTSAVRKLSETKKKKSVSQKSFKSSTNRIKPNSSGNISLTIENPNNVYEFVVSPPGTPTYACNSQSKRKIKSQQRSTRSIKSQSTQLCSEQTSKINSKRRIEENLNGVFAEQVSKKNKMNVLRDINNTSLLTPPVARGDFNSSISSFFIDRNSSFNTQNQMVRQNSARSFPCLTEPVFNVRYNYARSLHRPYGNLLAYIDNQNDNDDDSEIQDLCHLFKLLKVEGESREFSSQYSFSSYRDPNIGKKFRGGSITSPFSKVSKKLQLRKSNLTNFQRSLNYHHRYSEGLFSPKHSEKMSLRRSTSEKFQNVENDVNLRVSPFLRNISRIERKAPHYFYDDGKFNLDGYDVWE